MKRLLLLLFASFTMLSCSKDQDSSCAENNTGSLKIINSTAYTMEVYYFVDQGYYDPVTLNPGQSTTFEDVPAGTVEPYAKGSFGDKWSTITITKCETSQYTWNF